MRAMEGAPGRQDRRSGGRGRREGAPLPGPAQSHQHQPRNSLALSALKWWGAHTFGVHFTVQITCKGRSGVGGSAHLPTCSKLKLHGYARAWDMGTYLHGGQAGCWGVPGLDKCSEGWGSSRSCEGQSQSLS